MTLSLDVVTLGVPDVDAAHRFYTAAFSPTAVDHGGFVDIDLHGTGHLGLYGTDALSAEAHTDPATTGFRGYVLTYIVDQPSDLDAVVEAAVDAGARVIKPAKKRLFGEYSAVFEAPDGAIWKPAAATKKDTGPAAKPPVPTETAALLGVAEPKASKDFYAALGMIVDRDYGNKYVDFRPAPGTSRLGLMPRDALAKDVGVDEEGSGFGAVVLHRRAESPAEVDAVLAAAVSAGGHVTVPAEEADWGGYGGHFADPDGFLWKVASA